jgi:hypothetical protein
VGSAVLVVTVAMVAMVGSVELGAMALKGRISRGKHPRNYPWTASTN